MKHTLQKGFTLIELLVVIAIVAVLATVVILTLNPAELLRQARDANRVSDMSSLNSALSLYLADVSSIDLGVAGNCYTSATTTSANCGFSGTYTAVGSNNRSVNATGWVPVNFAAIVSGAPLGQLPIDPTNVQPYIYRYVASTTQPAFKLGAKMESGKYRFNGAEDRENTDGGTSSTLYESGSNLSL